MNAIDLQMKFFKEMTNRGYSQTQIADLWAATQDWIDAGIKPGSLAHLQLRENCVNFYLKAIEENADDLGALTSKYSFKSKKNKKMYVDVCQLIDKIIGHISKN